MCNISPLSTLFLASGSHPQVRAENTALSRIAAALTNRVKNMNTTEITDGSCWFQPEEDHMASPEVSQQVEERFLVKWNGLSYMHVSWETQADLPHLQGLVGRRKTTEGQVLISVAHRLVQRVQQRDQVCRTARAR